MTNFISVQGVLVNVDSIRNVYKAKHPTMRNPNISEVVDQNRGQMLSYNFAYEDCLVFRVIDAEPFVVMCNRNRSEYDRLNRWFEFQSGIAGVPGRIV